jgi:hypothetical protein
MLKIDSHFKPNTKYARTGAMQIGLERQFMRVVISSSIAMSFLDNSEFLSWIRMLNPQFRLPSRCRLTQTLIP